MPPILCLDFDGVCHSYTSGWQGATVIPDPPVDGMWAFLEEAIHHFEVHIYSSRSHQEGGIAAMRQWFVDHGNSVDRQEIAKERLTFPTEKPPAFVTLDDRAVTFTGVWPSIDMLTAFKPWGRR
jgi:hypothetical protein